MRILLGGVVAALALGTQPASAGHVECTPDYRILCVPLDTAERVVCGVRDVRYVCL